MSSAFCRCGAPLPLHTNCNRPLVPGWEAARRAGIPERHHYPVGKYLEPYLIIQSYFYSMGRAASLTASGAGGHIVWRKPFRFSCKIRNKPGEYGSMVGGGIPGKSWEDVNSCRVNIFI